MVAAAGTLTTAPLFAQSPATAPALPRPCPPSGWRKRGILFAPAEPWDSIQNFTCPVELLDDGRYRWWYSCGQRKNFAIGYVQGRPGEKLERVIARCLTGDPEDAALSIGHLPEAWKPTQVVHIRLPTGRHRIYFWAHGPEVLRYLAAESDDGRRYRVLDPHRPVLYHFSDRAAQGVPSPDGVVIVRKKSLQRLADEPAALPRLISNDATNVYQLPDGTFELYSTAFVQVARDHPAYIAHDNAPGLLRVIDRYTSGDGLHFETRQRVLERDDQDPVDQQFYYLAVTHTPRGRVGMLGHYRVQAQTMDIEWCFSPDGVTWHRPYRRAWIERGDKTQVDSFGIYAPHSLVPRDGQWHLFYTAVNSAHNGRDSHGPPRTAVMHATTDSIWA